MREYFIRYINEQEYQEAIDGKMNKGVSWHITPYSSSDLDEVFKIRDNFSSRKEYLEDTREDAPSWLEEGEYDIVDDAVRQRLDGLCGFPLDAGNDSEAIDEAQEHIEYETCANDSMDYAVVYEGEEGCGVDDGATFKPVRIVKCFSK